MKQFNIEMVENSGARLPQYSNPGYSGFLDIFSGNRIELKGNIISYYTGLKFKLDIGYVGIVYPRNDIYESGMSYISPNMVEYDDSGELIIRFGVAKGSRPYGKQELIAKMIILPFEASIFNRV